jgi:histidyl-tRNA synthetase
MDQYYKALRGTRDILPDEVERWQFLERTAREVFTLYGFDEIRTPIFESTELFARSVGESSDIVRKEMYTFRVGRESVTLRPENTASVVRAFLQHALHRRIATGFPERYFYIGPMFRHERPQRGRQRQFHQIGVEVLGAGEPLADAECLQMLDVFLDRLGLSGRELVLSSVGDENCRPRYRSELRNWLEPHLPRLCADCQRRFEENPLRVFDCKVEADQQLLADAPALFEMLCEPCEQHFAEVRRSLDRYGVKYRVDPRLVRGLDYYVRTVFETVSGGLGAQNAILGGGRYDNLVEQLGGPHVPAFGFAIGMERLSLLLDEERLQGRQVDVALIGLGAAGWDACIPMAKRFREAGLLTSMPVVERPLGAQLRRATRAGARYVVFVGQDELAAGSFGLKDLRSGEQVTLEETQILARIGERDERD